MIVLNEDFVNYSVSHNTLKIADLIESFRDFLKINAPAEFKTFVDKVRNLAGFKNHMMDDAELEKWILSWESETMLPSRQYLETLMDLLESIAPNGTNFGVHPGNSSDFGFWEYDELGI